MISSQPLRPPRPRTRSATRSLFTVGTVALMMISGTAGALAQPTSTPAPTPTDTPGVSPESAPADLAPPPVADPCATTTAPTTTAPTTTTTAPPTTTTAVPTPTCDTVPAPVDTATAIAIPEATAPAQEPAPSSAPAPAPPLAEVPLPAEPAADQPVAPTDDELSSKTAEPEPDWAPTENPNSTLVPGQMRSDREEVPAPFTKEDADRAEIAEARNRSSRAAVTCQNYWPSWFNVCGEIRDKYNSLGGPGSFLSYPSSGNIVNPGSTYGERVTFLNGPIYWSAATGAHPVVNSFLFRWGQNNYEAGWLKYPTTDEIVLPDGGRRQEFQDGVIYVAFQNAVGSAIRNGPLRDKYNTIGGLTPGGTLLGYPTQDQIVTLPGSPGQMARFERGVIYWHPAFGAHPVTGQMLAAWELGGYETGEWGYPAGDQYDDGGVPTQIFEHHVVDLSTEQLLDPVNNGNIISIEQGDAFTITSRYGTLNATRPSPGYDTRYLAWGWKLSDRVILNETSAGTATPMRCLNYTHRNGVVVNSSSKSGIPVTYHYHGSLGDHDDDTLYTLFVSCTFTNKTLKKNGNGVLAYGISSAWNQMAYEFRPY